MRGMFFKKNYGIGDGMVKMRRRGSWGEALFIKLWQKALNTVKIYAIFTSLPFISLSFLLSKSPLFSSPLSFLPPCLHDPQARWGLPAGPVTPGHHPSLGYQSPKLRLQASLIQRSLTYHSFKWPRKNLSNGNNSSCCAVIFVFPAWPCVESSGDISTGMHVAATF